MTALIQQAQAQSDAGGTATFKFTTVPPGYTWTFSIMPVVPQIPAYNFSNATPLKGQDAFGNAVWTFYRNNIPEFSWTGFSIPKNIQAQGSENIAVQGIGLTPNTQFTVTLKGNAEAQTGPHATGLVPEFDHIATPGGGPDSSQLIIGGANTTTGITKTIVAALPGVQIALWALSLTMSQTNASGANSLMHQVGLINTTGGLSVARVQCSTYLVGSTCSNAIYMQMFGDLLQVGEGLVLVSPAGGAAGENALAANVLFAQV